MSPMHPSPSPIHPGIFRFFSSCPVVVWPFLGRLVVIVSNPTWISLDMGRVWRGMTFTCTLRGKMLPVPTNVSMSISIKDQQMDDVYPKSRGLGIA